MATAAKHICRQARQVSQHRAPAFSTRHSQCLYAQRPSLRSLSTSALRSEEQKDAAPSADDTSSDSAPYFNKTFYATLSRDDKLDYRTLDSSERRKMERVASELSDAFDNKTSRISRELTEYVNQMADEVNEEFPEPPQERERRMDGFFNMGEKEDIGPDEEFGEDDVSSIAHGELEQQREMREYARLAGWEMPLLADLQVPFQPPTSATPLRFRYTTYMGEQHPASRKVVVEFDPSDLKLSEQQTSKLIKLLGSRYNPSTKTVKMSAEHFETQAQNRRYLGDTVNSLIAEAKDPKDTFEDVPFDFRHHKPKRVLRFPEEWLLTEERKRALEEKRRLGLEQEQKRQLISGVGAIEQQREIDLAAVEAPLAEAAQVKIPVGKMGKKEMGQKGRRS